MDQRRTISIASDKVTDDPIEAVPAGRYRLPGSDKPFSCPIRRVVIESSLAGAEHDLLGQLGFGDGIAIVADPDTYDALGQRIAKALPSADVVMLKCPFADDTNADELSDRTRHAQALVAVGSGTLNDLAKYVSHRRKQPYAVFATAPSMNGYTTATASISRGGEKLSLTATPPLGAFFDLEVLAAAPSRLIRAGVGDSLCRSTAQLDWLLSHRLLGTPYQDAPFALQADDEAALLDQVGDLGPGKLDAMRALVRLLVLGGFGMLIAGSSQPGSQGEHLISHYIDMLHRPHPGSLHGEQVGVATWTMASLQQEILAQDRAPGLRPAGIDDASLARRYGKLGAACGTALAVKALAGHRLSAVQAGLDEGWDDLRHRLTSVALPPKRLKAAFEQAGVVIEPQGLGIVTGFYREAIIHARELRDRFTMLDLAADTGLLERFVERHLASFTS